MRRNLLALSFCALPLWACGPALCGDGVVTGGEECDDGNTAGGDGCNAVCLSEVACGDNILDGDEVCDDGNVLDGDGCRADCTALEICGDGALDAGEACDEGAANGDVGGACTAGCQTASPIGYTASPTALAVSGNLLFVGLIALDENFNNGDGFVAVIDRTTNTEINRIPTSAPQPQFFNVVGDELYVVNSGVVNFLNFPQFNTEVPGSIDVISIANAATATAPDASIEFGLSPTDLLQGSLGRMAIETIDGVQLGVLGSSLTGDVYVVDLESRQVIRGVDNPVEVFDGSDLVSVFAKNGAYYALSFSSDFMCLSRDGLNFDLCQELGEIGVGDAALEGLKDIVFTDNGNFTAIFSVASAYVTGTVLEDGTLEIVERGPTGIDPERAVALGDDVLVVNSLDNNVLKLTVNADATTVKVAQFLRADAASNPRDLAFSEVGDVDQFFYVANQASNTVQLFDLFAGGTPTLTINVTP